MAESTQWPVDFAAALVSDEFVRMTLSRPVPLESGPSRVTVRPVMVQAERRLQWAERTGRQELHVNLTREESALRLTSECPRRFRQANLLTTQFDLECGFAANGRMRVRRRRASASLAPNMAHDHSKQYLIPEGRPCAFLEAVGVMTSEGRVRSAMRHKFRQINRFLELIRDVTPELPAEGTLKVVDFGSGKSYLTLAIHHLLTVIQQRELELIAVDRSPEIINACRLMADRLQLRGIEFRIGEIASMPVLGPVDMAVSLHACDTATDEALSQAVCWQARVILAAPCCQHELAGCMRSPPLELLESRGILKERFAALATDALRAAALEAAGYRTQVIEFIDLEHTAKNLLLRGIRRQSPDDAPRANAWRRFQEFKELLGADRLAIEKLPPWRELSTGQ